MKSYSIYLVKNADLDAISKAFGKAEPVPSSPWVRCGYDRDAEPPDDDVLYGDESLTQARSEELGEVIFVYGDTSIDGFVYEHARDGELLRKLVWFQMLDDAWTAGWTCVEGEPEPWEAALFSAIQLQQFLEHERATHQDEGRAEEFEAYAEQVRAHWESGRIVAGRSYPECDGTVAMLVERHYGVERQ